MKRLTDIEREITIIALRILQGVMQGSLIPVREHLEMLYELRQRHDPDKPLSELVDIEGIIAKLESANEIL